jgi:hypothetical protein
MTHSWQAYSANGTWRVAHTSEPERHTIDSVGVGLGEDEILMPTKRLAVKIADALTNAYQAGRKDAVSELDLWRARAKKDAKRARAVILNSETPYDPTTDDGQTYYGEGVDLPSYGD